MDSIAGVIALACGLPTIGCSGRADGPCPLDRYPGNSYCASAVVLALRDAPGVRTAQATVDDIYAKLKKAWLAYPQLRSTQAADRLASEPDRVDVVSTYSSLVAKWAMGSVVTGDSQVDSVFAANGASSVTAVSSDTFDVMFQEPINMRALAPLAAGIPQTMLSDGEVSDHGFDITLTSTSGGTDADFELSWGDCYVQCAGTHHFFVAIPDGADAQLTSESGDPVPQNVLDYAMSLPPPE